MAYRYILGLNWLLRSKIGTVSGARRFCYSFGNLVEEYTPNAKYKDESGCVDTNLSRLNPSADSYNQIPFRDTCLIKVQAGSGGNGCIAFARHKYLPDGPPSGGDGGFGGSVFIKTSLRETSLYNISRKHTVTAGNGSNGKGDDCNGKCGKNVLIEVPVGTVVKEIWRCVPSGSVAENTNHFSSSDKDKENIRHWLFHPSVSSSEYSNMEFPDAIETLKLSPKPIFQQAAGPIELNLNKEMDLPILLAVGGSGGLGNKHFVSSLNSRPIFAMRGHKGIKILIQLELKLLADVGLVGFPNAGKSTLLRSLTRSQTRIGHWPFTTLQPNIGTVVLDDIREKYLRTDQRELFSRLAQLKRRSHLRIADIPGIVNDAHLNKGLGLCFLRHVERAEVLAFTIDLSAHDAVTMLKTLWREVGLYDLQKDISTEYKSYWNPDTTSDHEPNISIKDLPPLTRSIISSKPWFVVATKADLPNTKKNFVRLCAYLDQLYHGQVEHPSPYLNTNPNPSPKTSFWKGPIKAIPVSAIRGECVDQFIPIALSHIDHSE